MENFEKFNNKVNNSVNNASTGNKKSTTAKYVAGIAVATVAIALVGKWMKKKFFSKPSPEVEEVKTDENGFEEIKETKK